MNRSGAEDEGVERELVDLNLLRLAFDLDGRDGASGRLEHRRHQHDRVARRDDLSFGCDAREPRREVDRIAKDIDVAIDYGTVVEADANADLRVADRRLRW